MAISKEKKEDILNKVASVEEDFKETNRKKEPESKHSMKGRQIDDSVIFFEIRDTDNIYKRAVKQAINEAKITKKHLYDIVGRNIGYNMIYSLDIKDELKTTKQIDRWLEIIGMEVSDIKFSKIE